MCRDKRCGNCEHFKNADEYGYGVCEKGNRMYPSRENKGCDLHSFRNGWTEITPDNVESLKQVEEKRIVIASKHNGSTFYRCLHDINGLDSMVKQGGYYYLILPELKIE